MRGKSPWGPGKWPPKNFEYLIFEKNEDYGHSRTVDPAVKPWEKFEIM